MHLAFEDLEVDLQQCELPSVAHIDGAEVEQGHGTIRVITVAAAADEAAKGGQSEKDPRNR